MEEANPIGRVPAEPEPEPSSPACAGEAEAASKPRPKGPQPGAFWFGGLLLSDGQDELAPVAPGLECPVRLGGILERERLMHVDSQ